MPRVRTSIGVRELPQTGRISFLCDAALNQLSSPSLSLSLWKLLVATACISSVDGTQGVSGDRDRDMGTKVVIFANAMPQRGRQSNERLSGLSGTSLRPPSVHFRERSW